MAKGLTDKQRRILEFIIDFQKENGFPPTIREIGDTFAIGSLRGVTVHLDALKRKGFLTRDRTSRSIRITAPDPRDPTGGSGRDPGLRLPLISDLPPARGDAAADAAPGRDSRYIETYVSVPEMLSAPATRDGFLLRIGAAGIRDEPILPGDLVVLRPQAVAVAAQLIARRGAGGITIARATGEENDVVGQVVGLIRRY